jgi:integrase
MRRQFCYPRLRSGLSRGLRAAELAELEWCDVDLQHGVISIYGAEPTRTGRRRRFVSITPNLQAWLSRYATQTGLICPVNSRRDVVTRIAKAGLGKRRGNLRRSFGVYHIAKHRDPLGLAIQMGVNPWLTTDTLRSLVKSRRG